MPGRVCRVRSEQGDATLVRIAFFASTLLCAALELPRYFVLASGAADRTKTPFDLELGMRSRLVHAAVPSWRISANN
eukprot:6188777-Pleurochrysis_carterae.AAC.2